MECEICFEPYDNGDRVPLILACKCQKVMCLSCVRLRLQSTARCPYCSIRWSVRNYVTQCRDGTPSDMLERMLVAFQSKEPEIPHNRASSVLGSGELRNYYEKFLEENGRKAEEKSAEQIGKDKILANVLFEKLRGDAANEVAEMKRIEEEDAALAAALSNEMQQKSGPFLPRNGKAFFRENKCGIYKFMDSKQAVAPSSSSSSDACAPLEVHAKFDVEKGMKRDCEREPTVYLETVMSSIKTFPSKTKPSFPVQQKSKKTANGPVPDGPILQNSFFFRKESSLKDSTVSPSVDRKSPFKNGNEQGSNRGRHECRKVIELINCCDDSDGDDSGDNTSDQVWALPRPETAPSSATSSTLSLVHNNYDFERDSEVIIIPSKHSSSSSSSSSDVGGGGSSGGSNSSSSYSSSSSGSKKLEATKKPNSCQQNTLQHSQSSHKSDRSGQSTHTAMAHRFEERKRPWEPDPRSGLSGGSKSRELSRKKEGSHAPSFWNCTACTYDNSALSLSCAICGTRKKEGLDRSTFHLRS